MRRAELKAALLAFVLAVPAVSAAPNKTLRVCADPNNLPFSDQDGAGFENELAQLLARDQGAQLEYTWWAQRRGALRSTLKAELCDVVMGVPSSLDMVATTKPYYTSSYVFVSKAERNLDLTSFDDPRLRSLQIGVQLVGDDYTNTPPVHALSARGICDNVRGYSVLGDYGEKTPAARILRAVATGEVDVAVVWGPLAGYVAAHSEHPLRLIPTPAADGSLPMRFSISMGVRRKDQQRLAQLNGFITRKQPQIDALLRRYGVPRP
jgi:mxaJ protein